MDMKRLATNLFWFGVMAASTYGFLYWAAGQVGN